MHISTLFLHTYDAKTPIYGHIDVDVEGSKVKVEFLPEEAAEIQAIAVRAWERKQAAIASAILSSTPAVLALPAPDEIAEGEFEEVTYDLPL